MRGLFGEAQFDRVEAYADYISYGTPVTTAKIDFVADNPARHCSNSGDTHPFHLHRHTFVVTKLGDKRTTGLMKGDPARARRLQT